MKKLFVSLFLALFAFGCAAQTGTRVKVTVTITNLPQNNLSTIVINGTTLFWTNTTGNGNGYVTIGTDNGTSATNLWAQLSSQLLTGPILPGQPGVSGVATNAMTLLGALNQAVTVTVSGTGATAWGSLSTTTQTVTNQTPVIVPMTAYASPTTRTLVASNLMAGMVQFAPFDWPVSLLTNNWSGSDFSNGVFFNWLLSNSIESNSISYNETNYNPYLTNAVSTNGRSYGQTQINPISTNGINYGNAFSSVGTASGAEQFGSGAVATSLNATAAGSSSRANGLGSTAVGNSSRAITNDTSAFGTSSGALAIGATAMGFSANAEGTNSTSIGFSAITTGNFSTALGYSANDGGFSNSTAIGYAAAVTANNQVMLGSPGVSTVVNNNLNVQGNVVITGVQTNSTFDGTNNQRGDMAFQQTNNTALASGNNADVNLGRGIYVKVSGPGSAFAIVGCAGGRDGRIVIIQNSTAQTWTILNDSGIESTAANRIFTGINATITMTNNPGFVQMIYDASSSHWCVINHSF